MIDQRNCKVAQLKTMSGRQSGCATRNSSSHQKQMQGHSRTLKIRPLAMLSLETMFHITPCEADTFSMCYVGMYRIYMRTIAQRFEYILLGREKVCTASLVNNLE